MDSTGSQLLNCPPIQVCVVGFWPSVTHVLLGGGGGGSFSTQCEVCEYAGCICIVVVTAATATANVAVSIIANVLDIGSLE